MSELLIPLDELIADVRRHRADYPIDTVLSLLERLAVLLRGHVETHLGPISQETP